VGPHGEGVSEVKLETRILLLILICINCSRHQRVVFVELAVGLAIEKAFTAGAPDVFVHPQEEILHPVRKGFVMSGTSDCLVLQLCS